MGGDDLREPAATRLGRRGQMDVGESVEFALRRESFGEKERTAARYGALRASIFRFDTGVEAIRLANARGHVVTLPFMGQMVWSAAFDGVELAMRSMFPVPRPARSSSRPTGVLPITPGFCATVFPARATRTLSMARRPARMDEIGIACGTDARGPVDGRDWRPRLCDGLWRALPSHAACRPSR